jgi:hypothetical protein
MATTRNPAIRARTVPRVRLSKRLGTLWDSDIAWSFRHSPVAVGSAIVLGVCLAAALFAPWIAPHNPFDLRTLNLLDALMPPAWEEGGKSGYVLGTDDQGRDVLSAIMFGARISLLVGLASVALAVVLGVSLGLLAGFIGGKADAARNAHDPGVRTDPEQAAEFAADTGVDALAVAVGSSHAMTEQTAHLDHHLIEQLAEHVPVPLVLHGSSGVPDDDLRRAVTAGVRKVNVGTALNVALTSSLRASLAADPSVTDPRRYLAPARTAMRDAVLHLLDLMAP